MVASAGGAAGSAGGAADSAAAAEALAAGRAAGTDSAYMSVPDKHQLYVTSTLEGRSGQPITVRRVYDVAQ